MSRSDCCPLKSPGIQPFQILSYISGTLTGGIALLSASSASKSTANGFGGAPAISRCDKGERCKSATLPASDSCTPRMRR